MRTLWFVLVWVGALTLVAGCKDEAKKPTTADSGTDGGETSDDGGNPAACPADAPVNSGETCEGALSCTYGTETCCGVTYPSLVCDCSGGQFACHYTDACLIPPGSCDDGGI